MQKGFSLLEVIVTIGFLSILMVPLSMLFTTNYKSGEDSQNILISTNLAQELMEEIIGKTFEESTGTFGNDTSEVNGFDRGTFDDIDDYDIYTTIWGAQSPPRALDGTQLTDFTNFSRTVSVVNLLDLSAVTIPRTDFTPQVDGSTGFKLVTVTVSWGDGFTLNTSLKYIASNF